MELKQIIDARVDATGIYCPLPIIWTAESIKRMEKDQVVEVLADDQGFPPDIRGWCDSTGHELLSLEEADGIYTACIRKK